MLNRRQLDVGLRNANLPLRRIEVPLMCERKGGRGRCHTAFLERFRQQLRSACVQ